MLESQKSSKRARTRGGTAPSCQPRKASSASGETNAGKRARRAGGGPAPTRPVSSSPVLEKLLVSAMTRHLRAAVRRRIAPSERGEYVYVYGEYVDG